MLATRKSSAVKAPLKIRLAERERFDPAVPLALIDDHPQNPRKKIGDVTELAQSIVEKGILQPLLLAPRGKRFVLAAGHRRKAGALKAGLKTAPCIIREMSDEDVLEVMLIENCQREDLTVVEEARAYQALAGLGRSERDIATRVGKSQPHVHKRLAILKLPPVALAKVDSGGITLEDAGELAKLASKPARIEAIVKRGFFGSLKWAVDAELKKEKDAAAVKKAKAECKIKRLTMLKNDGGGHRFRPSPPAMVIGTEWGELPIDKRAHAALPCHAVGISSDGTIVPCCTDRALHPELVTKGDAARAGRSVDLEAHQRRLDELRDAAARRRGYLARTCEHEGIETLIVAELIETTPRERLLEVAELLGLEHPPMPAKGANYVEYERASNALRSAITASARTRAGALRVAGMVVLVHHEDRMRGGDWVRAPAYFQMLERLGYKPKGIEVERLKRPTQMWFNDSTAPADVMEDDSARRCRDCDVTEAEMADAGGVTWAEEDLCSDCAAPPEDDEDDA